MREKHTLQPRGLALLLLLLLCGLLATSVQAKYIFTEEPLARFSPAFGDQDLFGYATALHLVDDSGSSSDFEHAIQNTKIIVGAPNGTFPGGLTFSVDDSEAINRTGLVYVCPISPPGDCEALTGTGSGVDIRLFDYEGNSGDPISEPPFLQEESKEGQFLGATIISSGEHIVICAPRWISLDTRGSQDFDVTRGHGRCFVAGRNLTNFFISRPCDGGSSTTEGGRSYCMAGTSAAIDETSDTQYSTFLGSPPFSSSNGAVFQYILTDGVAPSITQQPDMMYTHVSDFVYGGFSVALGNVINTTGKDLVSSLPKSNNYKGSVRVFDISTSPQTVLESEMFGIQMGEYFGWSVATADLNGDGFDEIIVGAPLFSTSDRIEKGRIFIYKNNGTLDTGDPIVIPGTGSKGRFGSAIANLGDINSDGFEDIAVSAPFESHEGGAEGTVYIYLGSGEDVINTAPEDTITAQRMSQVLGFDETRLLKRFGYSLSSGVDVDANANNDLVIGGYKQQTVIVLRTHSIANVSLSLATIPSELLEYTEANCNINLGNFACFELEITASFSGRGLDGRPLATKVAVRENAVSAGSRLFFLDSDGNRRDVFEGFLNFSTTGTQIKETIPVYVEIVIQDRRSPLSVLVTVSGIERPERNVNGSQDVFDLREFPLLNVFPQNETLTLAGCRNATRCEPDLELTLYSTQYKTQPESKSPTVVIIASTLSGNIHVTLNYRTLDDDASDSFLRVRADQNVFGVPSIGNMTCDMDGGAFECLVKDIFSDYEGYFTVNVTIAVSTSLVGSEPDSIISFTIIPGNDVDPVPGNNDVDVTVDITAVNRVTIDTVIVSPSMTQYENTDVIGQQEISTRVTLRGSGPTTIPQSTLTILIPGKTNETGEFYYLYPIRSSVSDDSVDVNCSGLNPDLLEQFTRQQTRRRRRQTLNKPPLSGVMERLWREVMGEGEEREEVPLGKRQEVMASVDCNKDPAVCTPVRCSIANFGIRSVTFTVTSVVDNRYFRNQNSHFTFVMRADYMINSAFFEQTSTTSMESNLLTVRGLPTTPLPVWVFIVSALVAIILITLIVIALFLLVICLRRRTKKKIRRATERRRSRHRTVTAGTGGGAVVTSLDTKPVGELDEKPKPPPPGEDVPDEPSAPPKPAEDGQPTEEPAEDPDETEL